MNALPPTREMERAYRTRDAAYDGIFLLGVRTTGIFCLPSCPARKPLPRNVAYFAGAREALHAGYRPCKRCRPLAADDKPAWVRKLLEEIERSPDRRITDKDLRGRGLHPARARRYFLRRYGMTFHSFARARRLGDAFGRIRGGAKLDDVALGHGYESHSGFRDAFVRTFGDAPGRSRRAGCIQIAWLDSPLGPLVAGATAEGICLLEFSDRRMLETQFSTLRRLFKCAIVPGENRYLVQLRKELAAYFAGTLQRFTLPLLHPGSRFQQRVWSELLKIPYGETRSYEDLARASGSPRAQRAAGRANGLNRIAILIPCHRVVNKNGRLGGYGGGLRRKEFLLELERGERRLEPAASSSATRPGTLPLTIRQSIPLGRIPGNA